MSGRKQAGAGIALATAFGFILAILGVAIYFLVQFFGAGNETHNAVDAGSLNVAKQATITPSIAAPSDTAIKRSFQGLIDPLTGGFDLLTYNRAVGQAFLVALNAQADGNQTAIQNAKTALSVVQGKDDSIGRNLKKALSDPLASGNWVKTYFDQSAARNPLHLTNNTAPMQWRQGDFSVAYLGQDLQKDSGGSNIKIESNSLQEQLPFVDHQGGSKVALPANAIDGTGRFLRGYQELKVDKVGSIFAVALSHEQPHLVSREKFFKQSKQPGANLVAIPPNTFFNGGQVFNNKSDAQLIAQAVATAGTASFHQSPYPLAIPNGYLIIDNSGTATYSGQLPNPDNVAANELGTGIQIDRTSGCFSDNGAVEDWQRYNRQLSKSSGEQGESPQPKPSLDGLFNKDGAPATLADAAKIGEGPAITCNDLNSDATNPNACRECVEHMTPAAGSRLGPFDQAYHPNGGYSMPAPSGGLLTSGEAAKMQVWALYAEGPPPGPPAVLSLPGDTTGMRLYPSYNNPIDGTPIPWGPDNKGFNQHQWPGAEKYSDPNIPGKVTSDGTILQLIQQTTGSLPYTSSIDGVRTTITKALPAGKQPVDELRRFVTNRIHQIKPNVTPEEIDTVFNTTISLGKIYYVYQNSSHQIVVSTTAPLTLAAMGAQGMLPDGTSHGFSKTFDLTGTVANPHYDFNIHDAAFTQVSPGTATETLTVTYTPASGAYNLLGVLKLQDLASNQGEPPPVFTERD